jgi:hypothetical protein
MIRFEPDTWRDVLLRPFAMVAPDSAVYVEIGAPDWRFAFAVVLSLVLLLVAWRRIRIVSPIVALATWLAVVFAIWLWTSGNGRYFVPGLLAVGPVCIALVYRLPGSRFVRASTALLLVAIQLLAVKDVSPWGSWGWARWRDGPYFALELDEQARTQPSTYVGVANISYSLVAPQFPPESRWINTSSLPDASAAQSPEVQRAQKLLRESKTINLLVPTLPNFMDAARNPSAALADEIDTMLNGQRLALQRPLACRLLRSEGLLSVVMGQSEIARAGPGLRSSSVRRACFLS